MQTFQFRLGKGYR